MTELNVTTNTRDTTPRGMLRGWVGRGIGRTALLAVASLVAWVHAMRGLKGRQRRAHCWSFWDWAGSGPRRSR
jgi:hypothetical protein